MLEGGYLDHVCAGVNQRLQPPKQEVKLFCCDYFFPQVTSEGIRLQAASFGWSWLCGYGQIGQVLDAPLCPSSGMGGGQLSGLVLLFWAHTSDGKNHWFPDLS